MRTTSCCCLSLLSSRSADSRQLRAIDGLLHEAAGVQLAHDLRDRVELRARALRDHERLIDLEETVWQRAQLRGRRRFSLERSLAVDREGVHFPARQEALDLRLRRHRLKHADLRGLEGPADEQLL